MSRRSKEFGFLSSLLAIPVAALIASSGTAHATLLNNIGNGGVAGVSGYYTSPGNAQYTAGAEGYTPNVSGSWSGFLDPWWIGMYFGSNTTFTLTADPGYTVTLMDFQNLIYGGNPRPGYTVLDHNGNVMATIAQGVPNWALMSSFSWPNLTDTQLTIVFATDETDNAGIGNIKFSQQALPPALIVAFGPGAVINQDLKTIAWTVPYGTPLTTLTPTITLSSGVCVPASGESPVLDGSNQATYTVTDTSADPITVNPYILTVTVAPIETTLLWDVGSGDWDSATFNWKGQASGVLMPFFNGVNTIFGKTAGGTITIASGMEPLTTTVSATSGTYTFSGGPLAGTGSLTKSGNGNLAIDIANNSYSGGTIIDAGVLTMGDQKHGALGTGPVTLNGGLLFLARINAANALTVNGGRIHTDGGWGCTWVGPVTLNADLNIEVPGYDSFTVSGSISGVGGITLNDGDAGTVALQAANSYTGPTSVTACTLQCNNIDALGSGALNISSTIGSKVNLNYTGEHNVAALTLGGMPQASGTYGSTASGAEHQDNTYFAGTGKVRVPASSFCNMLTFSFGALGAATIGDTTITMEVPYGTDRTNLAPTYTVSPGATGSPLSDTSHNFTSTQSYTVTAEDGITAKTYFVTVTEAVLADVFTWANPASGNWSDSSKWTNDLATGSAPLAGGRASYTLNFDTAGTYTATNNMNAGFELNQLNFRSTVTLAGNGLAFVANGPTLPTISQNSGSTVTISNDVALGSNATFGGSGNGQVNLSGSLTGTGMLTKNSSGALTLAGDFNTYSGGTTINAGSLSLGKSASDLLGTGPVVINSPAALYLNGNGNLTNEFTFNGATVGNGNSFSANLNGPVTLAATTVFDLGTTGNMSIGGNVSGIGGLTKIGTGIGPLILAGINTYTGPTTVAAGTLRCDNKDALGSGDLSINTGGAKMNLNYTATRDIASLTLGGVAQTAPGTYGSVASGATFQSDTYFVGSGTVRLGGPSGYAGWADANAPGQTPGQDYDNDGVQNGIEYFMGQTGSSFTAMPGLDGTNTITWTKDPAYNGTWQVQTSPDLGTWTDVAGTDDTTSVSYTLPPDMGKLFVRLLVTPTP
ncbi:MAG: autotransporter-associated beta strand repeat-containing protein [Verrucomicrobia bacterium]|nr:autotransporter-associated beta strand repeat-containing protein [Verrucomicrobiota bacterium]